MMTEDLSGDCLNIPAQWRLLHRPLFHSLQAPDTLQCIYSPNREGCYLNMWSLDASVGRKQDWQRGDPWPTQPPKSYLLCLQTWFLVVLLPELSANGSFGVILCPRQNLSAPPALAVSCASPYREEEPGPQGMGSLTCLLQRQQILTSFCARELYLLILNQYIHPGK